MEWAAIISPFGAIAPWILDGDRRHRRGPDNGGTNEETEKSAEPPATWGRRSDALKIFTRMYTFVLLSIHVVGCAVLASFLK